MKLFTKQSLRRYIQAFEKLTRLWRRVIAIFLLFVAIIGFLSWPGRYNWSGPLDLTPVISTLAPTQNAWVTPPTAPNHTPTARLVTPVSNPCLRNSTGYDALSRELRRLADASGEPVELVSLDIGPERITEETRRSAAERIAHDTPLMFRDGSVIRQVWSLGIVVSEYNLDRAILDNYVQMLLEQKGYPSPSNLIWVSAIEEGDCLYLAEWATPSVRSFWALGIVAPDGRSKYDSFLDLTEFVSEIVPVNQEVLALNYQVDFVHPTRLWIVVSWTVRISWESPLGCKVRGLAVTVQRHKTYWPMLEPEFDKSGDPYASGQPCLRGQQNEEEEHFLAEVHISERLMLSSSFKVLSFSIPSSSVGIDLTPSNVSS